MSNHPIVDVINNQFGGIVARGSHKEGTGKACILEVVTVARGLSKSDDPWRAAMPDIRNINDAYFDDSARSLAMIRLGVALWDWSEWTAQRKIAFAGQVALLTVSRILPAILRSVGLGTHADACAACTELKPAAKAAYSAYSAADAYAATAYAAFVNYAANYAADAAAAAANAADAFADAAYCAAYSAAKAAKAAADAAYSAAYSARAAAADARTSTLNAVVDIWVNAAESSKSEQGRGWEMRMGDCVELTSAMADGSCLWAIAEAELARRGLK